MTELTLENLTAAIRAANAEYARPSSNFLREVNDFKRKPPTYDVGLMAFAQFRLDFDLAAEQSGFKALPRDAADELVQRKDTCLKGLLYQCLTGTARAIAGRRMYPGSPECTSLTFETYSKNLESLFDSRNESDAAEMEFRKRKQQKYESPMLYVTDKVQLYERAYPETQRDLTTLCDELTSGLLNKQIQASLREFEPTSQENYEARLRFLANAQHKRLLAKEISHAEGIELHSVSMSYLNQNQRRTESSVKSEPGINAVSPSGSRCYWCGERGHFVAKCPRRLAGMDKSVNAIGENADTTEAISTAEADTTDEVVAALNGKSGSVVSKTKSNRKPQKWRRFQTKRDSNGVHYLCDYSDDDEPLITEGINSTEATNVMDPPTEDETVNTLLSSGYEFEELTSDFLGV